MISFLYSTVRIVLFESVNFSNLKKFRSFMTVAGKSFTRAVLSKPGLIEAIGFLEVKFWPSWGRGFPTRPRPGKASKFSRGFLKSWNNCSAKLKHASGNNLIIILFSQNTFLGISTSNVELYPTTYFLFLVQLNATSGSFELQIQRSP